MLFKESNFWGPKPEKPVPEKPVPEEPAAEEPVVEIEKETSQEDNNKLIEILQKECSVPILGVKDMPCYTFKELVAKFGTTNLTTIVENNEHYKELISKGFILGSGEERWCYEEKLGRVEEKGPANIHSGVDYMVEEGTAVSAMANGEVVEINQFSASNKKLYKGEKGFGNMILIKHKLPDNREVYSLYGHLGHLGDKLKVGDEVKKDQVIGEVGSSFTVENGGWPSHLHFSILKEREATVGYGTREDTEEIIDPMKIFKPEPELKENVDVDSEKRLEEVKKTLGKMGLVIKETINQLPEKARGILKGLENNWENNKIKVVIAAALIGGGAAIALGGGLPSALIGGAELAKAFTKRFLKGGGDK